MPNPATTTSVAACALEPQNRQVAYYIGEDQRLYALDWDSNHWIELDVIHNWQTTLDIQPAFPRPGTGPMSTYTVGDESYMCYIDSENKIWSLSFPIDRGVQIPVHGGPFPQEHSPNLTLRTGVTAAKDSPIASFGWQRQQSQHVIFLAPAQDGDGVDVYELYSVKGDVDKKTGGPLWQKNNLSVHTGYTGRLAPRPNGPLAGYMFDHEGTEHVIYIARDNTIRELYYSGGSWHGNNLSAFTRAETPALNSPLVGYVCGYENSQHVIYIGAGGGVHELYWTGRWQPDHNLNDIAGTPYPAGDSALAGYAANYERTHHVIYIDADNNIQELYRTGNKWLTTTLSASAGSGAPPPLNTGSPLAGYAFENQRTQHVWYLDNTEPNPHLHELYRSGNSWYAGEVSP